MRFPSYPRVIRSFFLLCDGRYGGIFERGSREYTLDDFHSLPLDKLDRYTCLKASDVDISTGKDDSSSDEDGEDDSDDDDDDDDTLYSEAATDTVAVRDDDDPEDLENDEEDELTNEGVALDKVVSFTTAGL